MKTLLLLGSILALLVLGGCAPKEPEAAPAGTPPAGVSQGGAPQVQQRTTGATSNQ